MKPWAITLAVLGGALLGGLLTLRGQAGAQAGADDDKQKRTLNATGTATVRVKPDSARLFFGLQSVAPGIHEARADNNAKVKKVHAALAGLKVPDLKSKTSDVTVELLTDSQPHQLPRVLGYRVTTSFTVLVKDDDRERLAADAGRVLDAALEAGATSVQQVVFFKQDDDGLRREALTRAVENAVANARALARGVKAEVRDTVAVSGQPQYAYYGRQQQISNVAQVGGGDGGDALVIGDLEITCTASVTCSY